jgi:hypothetical protein
MIGEMSVSTNYVSLEQKDLPLGRQYIPAVILIDERKKKYRKKLLSSFITAFGNFSVQYNFQAISISLLVMSVEECTTTDDRCRDGVQASWVAGTVTATIFAGAIAGQLTVSVALSQNVIPFSWSIREGVRRQF